MELDEPIIILEDDVIFNNNFAQGVSKLATQPFEFVRLMALKPIKNYEMLNENIMLTFGRASGTQGYFLRPSAAQKLIEKARFFTYALDDFVDKYYYHGVFTLIHKPYLIDMKHEGTTITMGEKTRMIRIWREVWRAIYKSYGFFWRILHCAEIDELRRLGRGS